MKNLLLCSLMTLLSAPVFAATITPMHVVEKASYQLAGLVNTGKIDSSYLTDVSSLSITSTDTGYTVTMFSPSADPNQANSLVIQFDQKAKALASQAHFVSRFPQGPVFAKPTSATILDLGAEAIVDHLSESADYVTVAQTVQNVDLQKEGTGILLQVSMSDGRLYFIHMDKDGNVTSQGF